MPYRKIIVANWKMNPLSLKEAEKLFAATAKSTRGVKRTDVIVCPPFIYLEKLKSASRRKKIFLGAQDAFGESTGAFTGEVSAGMLYELGVRYVILGHSEKRARGETDQDVAKKVKGALLNGLRPIVCVGESARSEDHGYFKLVKEELLQSLAFVSKNSIEKVIVAYEPIWAISTTPSRRNATPEDSYEMVIFIRKILADKFGIGSGKVKILYGGSVNDRDAEEFLGRGGVDGLLVGRASLSPEKFAKIITIAENLQK